GAGHRVSVGTDNCLVACSRSRVDLQDGGQGDDPPSGSRPTASGRRREGWPSADGPPGSPLAAVARIGADGQVWRAHIDRFPPGQPVGHPAGRPDAPRRDPDAGPAGGPSGSVVSSRSGAHTFAGSPSVNLLGVRLDGSPGRSTPPSLEV